MFFFMSESNSSVNVSKFFVSLVVFSVAIALKGNAAALNKLIKDVIECYSSSVHSTDLKCCDTPTGTAGQGLV